MSKSFIEIKNLSKEYKNTNSVIRVLRDINLKRVFNEISLPYVIFIYLCV